MGDAMGDGHFWVMRSGLASIYRANLFQIVPAVPTHAHGAKRRVSFFTSDAMAGRSILSSLPRLLPPSLASPHPILQSLSMIYPAEKDEPPSKMDGLQMEVESREEGQT